MDKTRAPRNRTITLTKTDKTIYAKELVRIASPAAAAQLENKIANQDIEIQPRLIHQLRETKPQPNSTEQDVRPLLFPYTFSINP